MKHKTLSTNGGTVHYWTTGDKGSCLTFSHGATMDHGLFYYQIDFFAKNHKIIVWDAPGHGMSRPFTNVSMQHTATALVQILAQEGIEKAHFIGQSMGAYIIQILQLQHPNKVITLTSVGGSPIQGSYYSNIDRWLLSITPSLLRLYPYSYLIRVIARQISSTKDGEEYALKTLQKLTKNEIAKIMETVYTGLLHYRKDFRLPCPLLITFGESDVSGKVQAYSRRWAELEERELIVIPHASHNANRDNPEFFNKILSEYIARHDEEFDIRNTD